MSTSPSNCFDETVQALAAMPGDMIGRIIVRLDEETHVLPEPKASDFSSASEYRKALIDRHSNKNGKLHLEAQALSLGLTVNAAITVNAVMVEGAAGKILELLKSPLISSAVLDQPFAPTPLPQPKTP